VTTTRLWGIESYFPGAEAPFNQEWFETKVEAYVHGDREYEAGFDVDLVVKDVLYDSRHHGRRGGRWVLGK